MSRNDNRIKSFDALRSIIGTEEQTQEPKVKSVKADKVHAPYNFVKLCDKTIIQIPAAARIPREAINEECFSGEIEYQITAKTPIMVSKGADGAQKKESLKFYRDEKSGKYAIPGSTMRGLIRNNVQILGMADVSDDIDDYRLMFREVGGGRDRKLYEELIGLNNEQIVTKVKAGYIENRGNGYRLTGTVVDAIDNRHGEMNYYTLSEEVVLGNRNNYPGLFPNGKLILQNKRIGSKEEPDSKNDDYLTYIIPITYNLSADNRVTRIEAEGGSCKHKGFAVSTGGMWGSKVDVKKNRDGEIIYKTDDFGKPLLDKNGNKIPKTTKKGNKKVIYIIPEESDDKVRGFFKESDPVIKAFQIDYEKKKNSLVDKNGNRDIKKVCEKYQYYKKEFFDLPKVGVKKPVFYIEHADQLYIGFTPRLRLLTERTIHEGIPKKRDEDCIDLAQSMFGYIEADGKHSYKSKVSFTNALLQNGKEAEADVSIIPGEPKPSFYPSYLKGENEHAPKTYNSEEIKLRGIKQYWIRDHVIPAEIGDNKNVTSDFGPLPKGSVFKGCIRFSNLTKIELGLLLWSIKLNDTAEMNIGYAKPYGYGAVKVDRLKVKTIDLEKAYSSDAFTMEPFRDKDTEVNVDAFIEEYQKYLKEKAGDNYKKIGSIRDFFYLKDSANRPAEKDMEYMNLKEHGKNEVRSAATLPTPGKLINKVKHAGK